MDKTTTSSAVMSKKMNEWKMNKNTKVTYKKGENNVKC